MKPYIATSLSRSTKIIVHRSTLSRIRNHYVFLARGNLLGGAMGIKKESSKI